VVIRVRGKKFGVEEKLRKILQVVSSSLFDKMVQAKIYENQEIKKLL